MSGSRVITVESKVDQIRKNEIMIMIANSITTTQNGRDQVELLDSAYIYEQPVVNKKYNPLMKDDLAYDFICCSVFYLSAAELCTIIIFKYNTLIK